MRKLMISIFGAACLLAAPAAQAEKYNLTLSGASPGGLWSLIGAGLDKSINKAYPGSTLTYQTGSGGLANVRLVNDKKVPMGLATDPELSAAINGSGPFKGKKMKDLRVLLRVYSTQARFQLSHILVNGDVAKKHNIKTIADLKKNARKLRVAFNRPGNMDGDLSIAILKAHGINIKRFKRVVRAASKEMTSLMLDRRIDVMNFGISFNHRRIREVKKGIPLAMLDIGPEVAASVATEFGGTPCIVKAKEYKFISAKSTSVCVGAVVVVHKSMSNKTAYNIVKGVLANIQQFKNAHRALKKATTANSMAEPSVAPHHAGAKKAFKEAGLL
ncbi:MAG: TAXI family TRAP transporter solute-binding subunit [Rhodospirillales bacterium]|jgi:hypothetical protein|nr:TAXI family TRAP transporter solute-binding subunit [Rhodospirillales bacterium]MBT4006611.1 TAXI family TRAP transporter solute-binding subunit [Rhodospirillales bacterium]MBT5113889.1 TAXI family TRAP transporter solute-binding subunit [Rhodospirillales bacterium]MBT5672417.1 TAXI family TRAP transporter solute-binding subunit [Rhodospirillales bacterium]MBT6185914.1 TAXI family TRAP transporter solute-binding subunit [Rhodospirillales bacterium]